MRLRRSRRGTGRRRRRMRRLFARGSDRGGGSRFRFARPALGLESAFLGGADPLEDLAKAPLALCLLRLELGQALGARGALLSLLGALFDLLETAVSVLHRALAALALGLEVGLCLLDGA